MKIGLVDVDSHNFPNLCLMKLSAFHKAKGDEVEFAVPLIPYDRIYMARVFDDTYTHDDLTAYQCTDVQRGGDGIRINKQASGRSRTSIPRLFSLRNYRYSVRISDEGMSKTLSVLHCGRQRGSDQQKSC